MMAIASIATAQTSASGRKPQIARLHVLEDEFAAAAAKGDVAWLNLRLSPDFVGIQSVGRVVNKADVLRQVKEQSANPGAVPSTSVNDTVDIRVYDNRFAVTTGRVTERNEVAGKLQTSHLLFTDVWLRRNGHWQVVSTQGTRMPPMSNAKPK